jgi:PIN domain nuclease of toxin-antitoxin system
VKPILLDTCALIWLASGEPLSATAEDSLAEADRADGSVVVSPISAWEIGLLVSKGRLMLTSEPRAWFRAALDAGFVLSELTPEVLIASSYLPSQLLRDPADKIIAATARSYGYRLMTRDRPLLEFGAAGHIEAIRC